MQKNYYYNTQYSNENNIQKKIITHPHIKQLKNVDINNLLINIKIKKNNDNKKKEPEVTGLIEEMWLIFTHFFADAYKYVMICVSYIVTHILFGAVSPATPFLIVMGVLSSLFSYIFSNLKQL